MIAFKQSNINYILTGHLNAEARAGKEKVLANEFTGEERAEDGILVADDVCRCPVILCPPNEATAVGVVEWPEEVDTDEAEPKAPCHMLLIYGQLNVDPDNSISLKIKK